MEKTEKKAGLTFKGWQLLLLGAVMGGCILILAIAGNPKNMGLCTACFIRDTVGALGMHANEATQYYRPEVTGLLLGSLLAALFTGRFKATSASAPGLRFLGGVILEINALVFLGCTLRMVIRMAAGDLSAWVGLVGFVLGDATGVFFLNRGFSLDSDQTVERANGYVLPGLSLLGFVFLVVAPGIYHVSESGPGSMHANIWLALIVAGVFGGLAFVTKYCFAGGVRNLIRFRDWEILLPIIGTFLVLLVYNLATGNFQLAAYGPIAHNQNLWNLLAMYAIGFAGVLFSGCPVRQVINAGSGQGNAVVTVLGMFFGAALAHNFGLAAAASAPAKDGKAAVAGGPGLNGKVAVIASIVILFVIAIWVVHRNRLKSEEAAA